MRTSEKESVMEFRCLASSGRVHEAEPRLIAPDFKHHNPFFPAGLALLDTMEENAKANSQKSLKIQHAMEAGDLVAIHSRVR